jgi:peroxiredoxin
MAQLRHDYNEFQNRQADIIVAGPENADMFADYFRENQLPFFGLPDPQHSVLKLYGQEVNIFKLGRMPAQVLVDKRGMVRYIHYGHAMSDIPENRELLALLDELNAE